MTVATWMAIAVLGPGALAVFVWFLTDIGRVLNGDVGRRPDDKDRPR
jgi:hypothetical protein